MTTKIIPSPQMLVEACFNKAGVPPIASIKTTSLEDEPAGYATIDGNMVTHIAGSDAVSNGAGI